MMWEGHVARVGVERNVQRVSVGNPKEKVHWKYQCVDGRMGKKETLGRLVGGLVWNGFNWFKVGIVRGLLNAVLNLRVWCRGNSYRVTEASVGRTL
jgi:hypothetical protein